MSAFRAIIGPVHLAKAQRVARPHWPDGHATHRQLGHRRIRRELRLHGAKVCELAKQPADMRALLAQGLHRWRMTLGGTMYTGSVRWGQRINFKSLHRPQWYFRLQYRNRRKPQADVWFLTFPGGGTIVLPACVIPPTWKLIRIPSQSPGYWMWRYWERWDILATLPNLPADLAE